MRPTPLHSLDVLGLDFETYFDDEYSLKKQDMSTSLYVRDPRFKDQCVGLQWEHEDRATWYDRKEAVKVLRKIPWKKTALLCHHTQFDGLILNDHFGIRPAYLLDTLSMGRALHGNDIPGDLDSVAKHWGFRGKAGGGEALMATKGIRDLPPELLEPLGEYCAQDVEIMMETFFAMLDHGFPEEELDIIDITLAMFTEPVIEVDRTLARKEWIREREKRVELFCRVAQYTDLTIDYNPRAKLEERERQIEPVRKLMASKEPFADLLRSAGVKPPEKFRRTPTMPEGRWIYAFARDDRAFMELQAHPDERVRDIVEARLAAKSSINATRAEGLLRRTEGNEPLPIYLNYCGAHTMRWSGGDKLNPQNFPDPAKGRDSKLRACLMAPRG